MKILHYASIIMQTKPNPRGQSELSLRQNHPHSGGTWKVWKGKSDLSNENHWLKTLSDQVGMGRRAGERHWELEEGM